MLQFTKLVPAGSADAVEEFLGGKPREVPDHYREADPMRLPIPQAAQVLAYGNADSDVPPEFSRQYVEKKKEARENVILVEMAKTDHYDLIDPRSAAWARATSAPTRGACVVC